MFQGCGITGMVKLSGTSILPSDLGDVAAATQALAHRGPNGEGMWTRDNVAFGHRRLSIVDLSTAGAQPMTRDHLTIVYNGELYNFAELHRELRDNYEFFSTSDTEVVLRAWQHWGRDALRRFNGMFAFAIWDQRKRALSLVRDRLGIKPLYFHKGVDQVVFGSEVEALMSYRSIKGDPNIDAFHHRLLCSSTLEVDPRRTMIAGVESVPPANCVSFDEDGYEESTCYWRMPEQYETTQDTDLFELLRGSVEGMLMGDVPVAAFLSGGLDSSAINVLASQVAPLASVTVAYAGDAADISKVNDNEDLRYSRMLVDHLNDRLNHQVHMRTARLSIEDIDSVCDLGALSEDLRHVYILANYRCVGDLGLRVVLNGQGADEIMGGYIDRPILSRWSWMSPDDSGIRADQLPGFHESALLLPLVLEKRIKVHQEVMDFYRTLSGTPLERAHRLMVHTQLSRVLQFEDFLSMRASVEARVPFLDHNIVEWCFKRKFDSHVDPGSRQGKQLLRQAMDGLLPDELRFRPKQVFPSPNEAGLRRNLALLVREHLKDLRNDDLISSLFDLSKTQDVEGLSSRTQWMLLATWRWHVKLERLRQ